MIAYLSGMRDSEVRELRRDCAFTEPGPDHRLRYKLRGRVFKGRQLAGDEAEWVVLEVVHQAVAVLLEVNDDPTHLFGYLNGPASGHVLLRDMPGKLASFRDHVNELFSTPEAEFIPTAKTTQVTGDDEDAEAAGSHEPLHTRRFRTLAWHIAHQPFGVVAGARQYQHAKVALFEGYAGTSVSGFAAEVAAEEAVAKLDYLEDLYQDWNNGGRAGGGAVRRIDAEFQRIRRELGDLQGVVASPARLRAMLTHLTTTLHPGVLNDCFYQPATAACASHARQSRRPLPMLNTCAVCPNARRSSIHLPQLMTARDQVRDALLPAGQNRAAGSGGGQLTSLQRTALTDYMNTLDRLLAEIDHEGPARELRARTV